MVSVSIQKDLAKLPRAHEYPFLEVYNTCCVHSQEGGLVANGYLRGCATPLYSCARSKQISCVGHCISWQITNLGKCIYHGIKNVPDDALLHEVEDPTLSILQKKVSEHLPAIKCNQKQTTGFFTLLTLPTSGTFLAAYLLADLITLATKGNDKLCHHYCRQKQILNDNS